MAWNVILADVQPNTTLIPGTGALTLQSVAAPVFVSGIVLAAAAGAVFSGYAPPLASSMAIQVGGLSLSGVPPPIGHSVMLTESVGSLQLVSSAPSLALGGKTFPMVGVNASGGDQSFGQATTPGFVSYTASGPGTAAYTSIQAQGSYDVVSAWGGSFEGWTTGGANRNKANAVTAIKGGGSFPNVKNASHPALVFPYAIAESIQLTSGGYPTLAAIIAAQNWYTYEGAGGAGTKLPSAASGPGFDSVNYCYAWPGAAGAAASDTPICTNVYGGASSGQAPAQTIAQYYVSALLTTNVLDTRFSSLTMGAAPNADGLHWDNFFLYPNAGGNLAGTAASWDGIGTQGNATIAAYPSGASSLLARGQYHLLKAAATYAAQCNNGAVYFNMANFGASYGDTTGNGNTHTLTANALDGALHGGFIEEVAGVTGPSWQSFMTATQVLTNYRYALGWCTAVYTGPGIYNGTQPQLVGVGIKLPPTDGSQTTTFFTGGANVTVTSGSALEYQAMRCMLCLTLMDNGFLMYGTPSYNAVLVRWYDENGDDSLTQVNVKRRYLGLRTAAPPTASAINGIWIAVFQNGIACWNPWGNGTPTLTAAQLLTLYGRNFKCMAGTQQPSINTGLAFTSYTFKDGDGLILLFA